MAETMQDAAQLEQGQQNGQQQRQIALKSANGAHVRGLGLRPDFAWRRCAMADPFKHESIPRIQEKMRHREPCAHGNQDRILVTPIPSQWFSSPRSVRTPARPRVVTKRALLISIATISASPPEGNASSLLRETDKCNVISFHELLSPPFQMPNRANPPGDVFVKILADQ